MVKKIKKKKKKMGEAIKTLKQKKYEWIINLKIS